MKVELVPRHGQKEQVQIIENALLETCPLPAAKVSRPSADPEVLLLMYGCGAPERQVMLKAHRDVGGNVVCFDRGYFGRRHAGADEHYRFALNHLHVLPEDIEATPDEGSRFSSFRLPLREDYDPAGHIVVAGLGKKSKIGLNLSNWDQKALAKIQARFPRSKVIYRPKATGPSRHSPHGVRWKYVDAVSPIETVLRGASLAVVRHSNVAVDACIAGVPVECEDGAAVWLYRHAAIQSAERRISFLNRLAWWNWCANEAEQFWKFIIPRCVK